MASRTPRRFLITVSTLTASVALLLTACGSTGSTPSAGGSGQAPRSVTISIIGQYLTVFAPIWAAEPELKAVEQKFGTTIEYSSFGKGSDALTAVLGGGAQICQCAFSTSLRAADGGQPVSMKANTYFGPGTVLVAATKFRAERGADVAKFDGATFGYTSEGGADQISLATVARKAGLNWERQKGVAVGSIAGYVPALQSGRVDLAMMDAGSAANAVRSGVGYVVLNTNDYDAYAPIGGAVPGGGLVFSEQFQKDYPELSQEIVSAVVSGLNKVRAQEDAGAAYDLLSQGYRDAHPDRAAFASEWQLVRPTFEATDGTLGPTTFAEAASTVLDTPDLPPTVAGFVDNTLVEKAYSNLGIPRPSVPTAS
ncbi:ABC transporter substrate-binding protein [Pseudonocardia kujensis]|uniref:ABC transporter substrate-binding protein n=1 Tax=Pseudonocardia kujensis TaxID=1128675 RepID=UPI001E59E2F0|nr:ABC transporter substrate-binding protein [Pseudonocardia kujensis]MCE0767796.1 ABC transporter substrate-binding protein [Pseudonocardia kujensis]